VGRGFASEKFGQFILPWLNSNLAQKIKIKIKAQILPNYGAPMG